MLDVYRSSAPFFASASPRVRHPRHTTRKRGVPPPEAWCPGDKVIVPPPKTSAAAEERVAKGAAQGMEVTDWYFSKKTL